MKKEIIIAGFGGQGVLSMGKILAYAGLMQGKEVTWMPAYGPEQRGGTANVTVILSDDPIASPLLQKYDIVVVLNQPSMDKFEPRVKPATDSSAMQPRRRKSCPGCYRWLSISHTAKQHALYACDKIPSSHHSQPWSDILREI